MSRTRPAGRPMLARRPAGPLLFDPSSSPEDRRELVTEPNDPKPAAPAKRSTSCPVCGQLVTAAPATKTFPPVTYRVEGHQADGKRCAGAGKLTSSTSPLVAEA